MELRHLKYFLTLAEELSYVKAAERLCISQPPLSRQIKDLEVEMKTRLFNRNNRRVELTDAGKYFEKEVRPLMQTLDRIVSKAEKIGHNISGEYRIGYISSTFSGDITSLIHCLSDQYPYVNFRLYEVSSIKQREALEVGKMDLGIVRGHLHSTEITTKLWFSDTYSVVFNKRQIQLYSEDDIKSLKDRTFVFFNKVYAPKYHDALLDICSFYGFTPKIVHESNNISSIMQLVKNGLGASIVPTNVLKSHKDPDLGFIQLKQVNLKTDVHLAISKSDNSEITQSALTFLLGKFE